MKITILAFVFGSFILQASGAEFVRSSKFESVQAFIDAAKSFEPAKTKGEMAALFSVKELGQPEDPKTGTLVPATEIKSCEVLSADGTLALNDSLALVWSKANPPTDATRSEVVVLFFLKHEKEGWQIADLLRFEASGKYCGIDIWMTSRGTLGKPCPDYVTVTEHQGGRGYSFEISASYKCRDFKFKRVDLE